MASTAVEDAVAEVDRSVSKAFVFGRDAKALLAVLLGCGVQWYSTHLTLNLLETKVTEVSLDLLHTL